MYVCILLLCHVTVNCGVLLVLLSTLILYVQPTRRELPSLLVPESEKEFCDRSIATLLLKDVHGLRTRVGQLFAKVGGSGRPSSQFSKPALQVHLAT